MAKFEQHVTIDAPVDKVWEILTNPATWGQWFPDSDSISGLDAVAAGATFQWRRGDDTGSGAIVEIQVTAEATPLTADQFVAMHRLAVAGVRQLVRLQRQVLGLDP